MSNRVMTEPAFFVLTALVDEPRHGYGIVGEVSVLSGDRGRNAANRHRDRWSKVGY